MPALKHSASSLGRRALSRNNLLRQVVHDLGAVAQVLDVGGLQELLFFTREGTPDGALDLGIGERVPGGVLAAEEFADVKPFAGVDDRRIFAYVGRAAG